MNENIEVKGNSSEVKTQEANSKFKFGGKFGKFVTTAITGAALATGGALAQDQPVESPQEITCPSPDESIENVVATLKIPQKDAETICFSMVFGLPEKFKDSGAVLSRDRAILYIAKEIEEAQETSPEDFSEALLLWILVGTDHIDKIYNGDGGSEMDFNKLLDWVTTKPHEERLRVLQTFGFPGLVDDKEFEPITDLDVLMPEEIQHNPRRALK